MAMLQLFDQYCWCSETSTVSSKFQGTQNYYGCTKTQGGMQFERLSQLKPKIRKRKRKNCLPEIDNHIEEVLECLKDGSMPYINACPKNINALTTDNSGRRSKFIGVSKNGQNWQVLINMGKYKKYIGTYTSEDEAAIAYDFYSICLHSVKAKTNFSYTKGLIFDMIGNFKGNNKIFQPSRFLSIIN